MSNEAKLKISKANKGRVHTNEARHNMSIGQLNRFKNGDIVWNKGVKNCFSNETLQKMSKHNVGMKGKKHKESTRRLMSNNCIGSKNPFYNKHQSEEVKNRISIHFKNTVWITKDSNSKRILYNELSKYLDNGWHRGRNN